MRERYSPGVPDAGPDLPTDGLVAVVKRDCPTCVVVAPVLAELPGLTVFTQDDPAFPESVPAIDDTALDVSLALDVRTVPTLLRFEGGAETGRTEGWLRPAWEELAGVTGLGARPARVPAGLRLAHRRPGVRRRAAGPHARGHAARPAASS